MNDSDIPTSDLLREMQIYDSNQLLIPISKIESSNREDRSRSDSGDKFHQGKSRPTEKNYREKS